MKNCGPSLNSSQTARRPRFFAAFTKAGRSSAKSPTSTIVMIFNIHEQNWGDEKMSVAGMTYGKVRKISFAPNLKRTKNGRNGRKEGTEREEWEDRKGGRNGSKERDVRRENERKKPSGD